MGKGIALVVWLAERVQEAGGRDMTGPVPRQAMLLAALALILMTGLTSRLRILALPVLAAAGFAFLSRDLPDALVSEDAGLVALRTAPGTVAVTARQKRGFVLENWSRLWPGAELMTAKTASDAEIVALLAAKPAPDVAPTRARKDEDRDRFLCSKDRCVVRTHTNDVVVLAKTAEAAKQSCKDVSILIITDASVKAPCRDGDGKSPAGHGPRILGAQDLALRGSAELRFASSVRSDGETVEIRHALSETLRPWHVHRTRSRAARGLAPWKPKPRPG